jgi:hypothetical protein
VLIIVSQLICKQASASSSDRMMSESTSR